MFVTLVTIVKLLTICQNCQCLLHLSYLVMISMFYQNINFLSPLSCCVKLVMFSHSSHVYLLLLPHFVTLLTYCHTCHFFTLACFVTLGKLCCTWEHFWTCHIMLHFSCFVLLITLCHSCQVLSLFSCFVTFVYFVTGVAFVTLVTLLHLSH